MSKPFKSLKSSAPRVSPPGFPRSEEEVMAHFKDRHQAVMDEMDAAHKAEGSPSFDDAKAKHVTHPDGSKSVQLSLEMISLIKLQCEMFEYKFGYKIGKHDPIFFDLDADTPQRDEGYNSTDMISVLSEAAQEAGVPVGKAIEYFMGREELEEYRKKN